MLNGESLPKIVGECTVQCKGVIKTFLISLNPEELLTRKEITLTNKPCVYFVLEKFPIQNLPLSIRSNEECLKKGFEFVSQIKRNELGNYGFSPVALLELNDELGKLNKILNKDLPTEETRLYLSSGEIKEAKKLLTIYGTSFLPLFLEVRNGNAEEKILAVKKITESNIKLVRSIIWKNSFFFRAQEADPAIDMDDLFQEGVLGLIKAIKRYKIEKGVRFATYAWYWIMQQVTRFLHNSGTVRWPVHLIEELNKLSREIDYLMRRHGRMPSNEEIINELDVEQEKLNYWLGFMHRSRFISLDAEPEKNSEKSNSGQELSLYNLFKSEITPADIELENKELREKILNVLGKLTKRERYCIENYFGLRDLEAHTLEEIGFNLQMSRERIRQIIKVGLDKLWSIEFWEDIKDYFPNIISPEEAVPDKKWQATFKCAEKVLSQRKEPWMPEDIISEVANFYQISPFDIMEKANGKRGPITEAKKVSSYLLVCLTRLEYKDVSKRLGYSTAESSRKWFDIVRSQVIRYQQYNLLKKGGSDNED